MGLWIAMPTRPSGFPHQPARCEDCETLGGMTDRRSIFEDLTRCRESDCGATVAYPHPPSGTTRITVARAGLNVDVPDRDILQDDIEFATRLMQMGWTREGATWVCPKHRSDPLSVT
jgi:hypothetical protein